MLPPKGSEAERDFVYAISGNLSERFPAHPNPRSSNDLVAPLHTIEQLDGAVDILMECVADAWATCAIVPTISPRSNRWWTVDCSRAERKMWSDRSHLVAL